MQNAKWNLQRNREYEEICKLFGQNTPRNVNYNGRSDLKLPGKRLKLLSPILNRLSWKMMSWWLKSNEATVFLEYPLLKLAKPDES